MSNTRSSKGPATFYNDSTAIIDTARHVRVDVQGLKISGESANVASHDRLRGFNTDFDSLPLLGMCFATLFGSNSTRSEALLNASCVARLRIKPTPSLTGRSIEGDGSREATQRQDHATALEKMELNPLVVDLETPRNALSLGIALRGRAKWRLIRLDRWRRRIAT